MALRAPLSLDLALTRWATVHAVLMLIATGLALSSLYTEAVLTFGLASVGGLLSLGWKRWTPHGAFGWANTFTLARLGALLLAAYALPTLWGTLIPVGLIGLAVLISDGLDGWLARRRGESSAFGAFFDKESDALALLILVVVAIQHDLMPAWAVVLGALRYVYVLVHALFFPDAPDTYRNPAARIIYVVSISGVLLCYLPFPAYTWPLAAIATLLLSGSFAHSFWWLFTTPPTPDTHGVVLDARVEEMA